MRRRVKLLSDQRIAGRKRAAGTEMLIDDHLARVLATRRLVRFLPPEPPPTPEGASRSAAPELLRHADVGRLPREELDRMAHDRGLDPVGMSRRELARALRGEGG